MTMFCSSNRSIGLKAAAGNALPTNDGRTDGHQKKHQKQNITLCYKQNDEYILNHYNKQNNNSNKEHDGKQQ